MNRVRVESDGQVGSPVYRFILGLEPGSDEMKDVGRIMRLGVALSHELDGRGDDTFPSVKVLSATDWNQHFGA